jgi:hypothetical protein
MKRLWLFQVQKVMHSNTAVYTMGKTALGFFSAEPKLQGLTCRCFIKSFQRSILRVSTEAKLATEFVISRTITY